MVLLSPIISPTLAYNPRQGAPVPPPPTKGYHLCQPEPPPACTRTDSPFARHPPLSAGAAANTTIPMHWSMVFIQAVSSVQISKTSITVSFPASKTRSPCCASTSAAASNLATRLPRSQKPWSSFAPSPWPPSLSPSHQNPVPPRPGHRSNLRAYQPDPRRSAG